jgi:hypothetical protein
MHGTIGLTAIDCHLKRRKSYMKVVREQAFCIISTTNNREGINQTNRLFDTTTNKLIIILFIVITLLVLYMTIKLAVVASPLSTQQ